MDSIFSHLPLILTYLFNQFVSWISKFKLTISFIFIFKYILQFENWILELELYIAIRKLNFGALNKRYY